MKEKAFQKLLKKDKFQLFLFKSRIPLPASFAYHTWFVTKGIKGGLKRWEVWQKKNMCPTCWGHLHLNLMQPLTGINISKKNLKKWDSSLIDYISGDKDSIAAKMIRFLEKNAKKYPYKNRYKPLPGPNSNTFPQWLIDYFPESKLKLPFLAIGKNYR